MSLRPWTHCDDEVLRSRYPNEPGWATAQFLDRSLKSVYQRAFQLKLRRTKVQLPPQTLVCDNCGKSFERRRDYKPRHAHVVCSNACSGVLRRRPYDLPSSIARFNKLVSKSEAGCWKWLGDIQTNGYGRFCFKPGVNVQAHRAAYFFAHGLDPATPFSKTNCVCHKCDVRDCVNPDHLWLGTQRDNVVDMFRKGRRRIHRGEENARSKFTWDQVREIRRNPQRPQSETSKKYGASKSAIRCILLGITWKETTQPQRENSHEL